MLLKRIFRKECWFFLLPFWAICFLPANCRAILPHEILVIANRNAARSIGLAQYYMERRAIPKDHLLKLWVTDKEWCDRDDYDRKVASPVRKYLKEKDPKGRIRCLVTMYGLPLGVLPPKLTEDEKTRLKALEIGRDDLKMQMAGLDENQDAQLKKLKNELDGLSKRIAGSRKRDQRSSLDSEIALVLEENYSLAKWIPNPYFIGYRGKKIRNMPEKALMVSRLDGPSSKIVRRIIDDSITAERTGLKGTAYFDARWPRPGVKQKVGLEKGYKYYDRSIYLAAEKVKKSGRMDVVINDKREVFQPGECPDTALYCGWYSLARYVDAFSWRPGSIGYHIASGECSTLKRKNSRVWCKMMLEKGAAATIGPVSEPFVQAFPIPELFFGLLVEGRWNLAEAYVLAQPFWSWQMVLIGDPLYMPFGEEKVRVK